MAFRANKKGEATRPRLKVMGKKLLFLFGLFLDPRSARSFHDQTLLDGAGGYTDIPHFAINNCFHALKIWKEAALRNRGYVRPNTTLFLRFATPPDVTALDRAFSGYFANSCHKILFFRKER